MRLFRKNDEEMMSELYKIHCKDENSYISMYHKNTSDLEELMTLGKNTDMEELDKAWTMANPEE